MGTYSTTYNKENFISFLKKNNVNDNVILKFIELPEYITRSGNTYDLYINSIWYNVGNTYYNFELNYYCENEIEFLFSSKVLIDVELSINNILYELNYTKK